MAGEAISQILVFQARRLRIAFLCSTAQSVDALDAGGGTASICSFGMPVGDRRTAGNVHFKRLDAAPFPCNFYRARSRFGGAGTGAPVVVKSLNIMFLVFPKTALNIR